jgi:hypothetical protein
MLSALCREFAIPSPKHRRCQVEIAQFNKGLDIFSYICKQEYEENVAEGVPDRAEIRPRNLIQTILA